MRAKAAAGFERRRINVDAIMKHAPNVTNPCEVRFGNRLDVGDDAGGCEVSEHCDFQTCLARCSRLCADLIRPSSHLCAGLSSGSVTLFKDVGFDSTLAAEQCALPHQNAETHDAGERVFIVQTRNHNSQSECTQIAAQIFG